MNVSFEDVSFLFEAYKYYYDDNSAMYWYRYMWTILEKHDLTKYEDDIEYYAVMFRAVALVYIFLTYVSKKDGTEAYPDNLYENHLADVIPPVVLGQLYAKRNRDFTTDASYAVFGLAQMEHTKICDAIWEDISPYDLWLSLSAVGQTFIKVVGDEKNEPCEIEWKPQCYEEYLDLITNHADEVPYTDDDNADEIDQWVDDESFFFENYL